MNLPISQVPLQEQEQERAGQAGQAGQAGRARDRFRPSEGSIALSPLDSLESSAVHREARSATWRNRRDRP